MILGTSHTVKGQGPSRTPNSGFQREVGGPVTDPGLGNSWQMTKEGFSRP